VPIGDAELGSIVAALRKALDPSVTYLRDVPAFDIALAYRLYAALLEPVKAGWESATSLLVSPHGALAQLPLALLPTRAVTLGPERTPLFAGYRAVPWLVRTHAVTTLPSVASLRTLRTMNAGAPGRRAFVGFGDPHFTAAHTRPRETLMEPQAPGELSPRGMRLVRRDLEVHKVPSARLSVLPRLPDTVEEIQSIARVLGAGPDDVFLGARANEHAVKTTDLARYRVLALATHGLVPGELDGLTQPALALSAPEIAGVEGDGLLTMEEILALRLDADWVVLSACNTAAAGGTRAEALSGLGRAFFYAGARALLVSHWPVETTSARALTTDLFQRQVASPHLDRAEALQQTLNWLIDEGGHVDPATNQVVFSYAHPLFWAPFTIVGDGGGARMAVPASDGGVRPR
jgi:CHAT domain-containing protein